MKPTSWATILLSLLISDAALSAPAPTEPPQNPSHPDIEVDFDNKIMPSPEQVLAENTPAPSKAKPKLKAGKTTLTDPRGFHSAPYFDTEAGGMAIDKAIAPEPEPRERIRPELHDAPGKPWYRKFYARFDMGEDVPKNESNTRFKNSHMLGFGLGYNFFEFLRADISFQTRQFKTNKSTLIKSIKHEAIFLNWYLNLLETNSIISPYLMAGLGQGRANPKGITVQDSTENLAITTTGRRNKEFIWNVGAGALFSLHPHVKLEAGYKYVDFDKFKSYTVITSTVPATRTLEQKSKLRSHEFACSVILNL